MSNKIPLTKEEKILIVNRLEAKLGSHYFYDPEVTKRERIVKSHGPECGCKICFIFKLDTLIAKSEKVLQDMQEESQEKEIEVEEINYIDPRY